MTAASAGHTTVSSPCAPAWHCVEITQDKQSIILAVCLVWHLEAADTGTCLSAASTGSHPQQPAGGLLLQ